MRIKSDTYTLIQIFYLFFRNKFQPFTSIFKSYTTFFFGEEVIKNDIDSAIELREHARAHRFVFFLLLVVGFELIEGEVVFWLLGEISL